MQGAFRHELELKLILNTFNNEYRAKVRKFVSAGVVARSCCHLQMKANPKCLLGKVAQYLSGDPILALHPYCTRPFLQHLQSLSKKAMSDRCMIMQS